MYPLHPMAQLLWLDLRRGLGARRANAGDRPGPIQNRDFLTLRDQGKDRAKVVMDLTNGDGLNVQQHVSHNPHVKRRIRLCGLIALNPMGVIVNPWRCHGLICCQSVGPEECIIQR